MDTLGKRLKATLDRLGVEASPLGKKIGKSKNYIGNIVNGTTLEPSFSALQAIGKELGVDPQWLKDGDTSKGPVDPYPSRAPAVAFLRARSDIPMGVADALEGMRMAEGDPGEDFWWEMAEKLTKRAQALEESLGLGAVDTRVG